MAKLFIIGNGFDLYHSMPTWYTDYRKFLIKNHHEELLNWFEDRIDFDNDRYEWNDIENYSNLNCEDHFEDIVSQNYSNIGDDNFRDSNWYDINSVSKLEFSNGIEFYGTLFKEWIETIEIADKEMPLLSSILSKDDYFVSFNYTKTLENLYGIPNDHVFHIHGCIGDKWLQFGSINNNPNNLKKILEDRYADEDFYGASVEFGVNNAVDLYQSAYKDVDNNLRELNMLLNRIDSITKIDNIVIFGHSVKEDFMDKPYYEKILVPRYRNHKWSLYFYDQNDKENQLEFIDDMELLYYEQIKE